MKQDVHDSHAEHGITKFSETFRAAMLCVVGGRRAVSLRLAREDIEDEISVDGGECWDVVHAQVAIELRMDTVMGHCCHVLSSSSSMTRPLIPERFVDVPSQRLYYLSLGCLLQASPSATRPFWPLTFLLGSQGIRRAPKSVCFR